MNQNPDTYGNATTAACTGATTIRFPPACPEVPVTELTAALACYRDRMGFAIDGSGQELGLAGLSLGKARIFLSDTAFRARSGNRPPVMLPFNPSSRAEVDAIHAAWSAAGAHIASPPQAQPYKRYEFFAQDPDGNGLRVFYDFGGEA